jgi:hypothetical protein
MAAHLGMRQTMPMYGTVVYVQYRYLHALDRSAS